MSDDNDDKKVKSLSAWRVDKMMEGITKSASEFWGYLGSRLEQAEILRQQFGYDGWTQDHPLDGTTPRGGTWQRIMLFMIGHDVEGDLPPTAKQITDLAWLRLMFALAWDERNMVEKWRETYAAMDWWEGDEFEREARHADDIDVRTVESRLATLWQVCRDALAVPDAEVHEEIVRICEGLMLTATRGERRDPTCWAKHYRTCIAAILAASDFKSEEKKV